jgi:LmbE family N-acetylglucosaminyl deacetylase
MGPIIHLKQLFSFCKWQARLSLTFLGGVVLYGIPDLVRYSRILKENARKLMIIAHPDDETLFFSRILLSDDKDIVVFCLTNGYDPVRRKEFYRAMAYYGVKGYMMKLPDQTAFTFLFNNMTVSGRLGKLRRRYCSCDTVYTHNLEGEYGHRHHRMIGRHTARIFQRATVIVPVSSGTIGDEAHKLSAGELLAKEYVFRRFYLTQAKGVRESLPAWYYHEKLSSLIASGQFDKR